MTVIGKILTFLVFFLSLVFLGFAVTINKLNKDPITKNSWAQVAKANKDELDAVQRDLVSARAELERQRNDDTVQDKKLQDQINGLNTELTAARDKVANAENRAQAAEDKFGQAQVAVDAAVNELKQRRDEANKLYATLKDKDQTISTQTATITRVTNERIQHQVAAQSFSERLKALEKEYQTVVKSLEETREQLNRGGLPATPSGERVVLTPPPDQVQGIVESVQGNMVQISIGSDQGLQVGHTLEVFRLEPKPEYLGPIRIVKVESKKAVGKMLMSPQKQRQVQPNDQVASSILATGIR